jgi:hypothetical protein
MCSLAYEFLSFGTFHTSGEERSGLKDAIFPLVLLINFKKIDILKDFFVFYKKMASFFNVAK